MDPRHALPRLLPIAACLLALVVPSGAQAAASTGASAVKLGGRGFESLRGQGVAVSAQRPARLGKGVLRLPVRRGLVRSSAYLDHSGGLRLRTRVKGRLHTLALARLQARLGARSRIIGTIAGERFALFAVRSRPGMLSLNAGRGSVSLRGATLTLSERAARAIMRRLRLRRLPRGTIGSLTVDALVGAGSDPGETPGGGTPTDDGPPQSGPLGDEPPLLARPASAVDVRGGTLTWHLRDSWIRYASTEQPPAALEGAVAEPAIPQSAHPCPDSPAAAPPGPLVYSYSLPFARGWHDAASNTTALYFDGGVRFRYLGHGIDLDVKSLEIELNGAASRALARFDGRGDTNTSNKRGALVDLAPSSAPPGAAPTLIRGSIPAGGSQSAFAGFYGVGEGFGCVSVSYSVP